MKYTEELLREAVAAAQTMADVLRHLGVPLNGGAHAHLRRRIDALGISTSHFLGRAHHRGQVSRRRLSAAQVLVLRSPQRQRADPATLRRALVEVGRKHRCALCGVADQCNGHRLTLQVDHINGVYWDCTADNLRFLCPNCHSQTANYAGRNRRVHAVAAPSVATSPRLGRTPAALGAAEVAVLLRRVDRGELTVTTAATLIGCHRNHVYRLRRRLVDQGSVAPALRRRPKTDTHRDAVVAYALRHPELGPKRIALALRERAEHPVVVAHGTVAAIPATAGLATRQARHAAAAAANPDPHRH